MKKALLIGWRSGAAQAVEAVGYAPTCIITPADKPAALRAGFDGGLVTASDPADVEQVLAALKRHHIDIADFAAVGTNLERCMVTASTIGALGGARSIPVHTAVLLRDKIAQKAAVGAAGLPVATCHTIDTLDDLPSDPDVYPLVVKPLAGEGTRETHLLQDAPDARRLAEARPANAGHGPWAVEEFIDGAELQIDGVVRDGQLCGFTISRYLQNLIAIKTGGLVGGVLLNPEDHLRLYEQATDLTTAALTALGHTDGVFHLEAFDQGHRLVFSECAGRVSGGLVREMLVRKLGLDLTAEWARALVRAKPEIPAEPRDDLCYGFANLAAPPGEIVSMPTTADVLLRDLVVEAAVELGPGLTAPDQTTASNLRAGRFIASADSEKAVEAAVYDTLTWFADHTIVK
ncbi:ATP-grasp domain-containing protein [Streptomyces durhamensis]|uniref:ATP-grasp domain-containing protein n=1 Tax=Streptomyces durhamensis TaxID=68194 RepID=UPI00068B545B|nr:ATP-grasp domain-containing protein [Streptomyces durhamensis]URS64320.1 VlpF [Streptomyces durhamensis]